jgi:hypothetical protein
MNNRWSKEEESKLLKLVASGKTYAELVGGFNRSENALEMRVKKIIYENMTGGKSPSKISELLNIGSDKVMQYYYSYKEHLDRENRNNMEGGSINKMATLENNKMTTLDNIPTHNGGNNTIKIDKIDKLRLQNEKLKLLLDNYMLKHKLSKVMKSDKNIQNDILKALLDK